MKRKAVLIESSNVNGQTDLPGARIDIENWKKFLLSELGGNWSSSEIVELNKPLSSDVKAALDVASDCYCFVVFSGHGSEGSVVLNDHLSSFSLNDLRPKTDKGTLVVDSCRGITDATSHAFAEKSAARFETPSGRFLANSMGERPFSFNMPQSFAEKGFSSLRSNSEIWADELLKSNNGTVKMLSCAKGQAAGENPKAGGYYTSLLMQSAKEYSNDNSSGSVQTTRQAHNYAASKLPPQQTPEYSPLYLAFPFAVSL
jgi:hypothetical protein